MSLQYSRRHSIFHECARMVDVAILCKGNPVRTDERGVRRNARNATDAS